MSDRIPVYVFRDNGHFARAGKTVVSAAPLDHVVAVYGGGGIKGEAGLAAVFGDAAYFRNEETGCCYLGVCARKASRFRNALRRSGVTLDIAHEPPPARLMWFQTEGSGPQTPSEGAKL
jgi:hypothetical protein